MLLQIDPTAPEPLFDQLADQLRRAVVRRDVAPGERLPAAKELAASLQVNQHTVLRAYQLLRDEGLIELRRGRGAVVRRDLADHARLGAAVGDLVAAAEREGVGVEALVTMVRQAACARAAAVPDPSRPHTARTEES